MRYGFLTLLNWDRGLVFDTYIGINNAADVKGDALFIGLGDLGATFLEINLLTQEITQKNDFLGVGSEQNITSWFNGDKFYVLRTALGSVARFAGVERMEVWELDPDAL